MLGTASPNPTGGMTMLDRKQWEEAANLIDEAPRTLRDESTPEGRKIWADVDKAASRAPCDRNPTLCPHANEVPREGYASCQCGCCQVRRPSHPARGGGGTMTLARKIAEALQHYALSLYFLDDGTRALIEEEIQRVIDEQETVARYCEICNKPRSVRVQRDTFGNKTCPVCGAEMRRLISAGGK